MLYQALSEQTSLFKCLRSDRKISTLFTRLFPYGNGPFHTSDLDTDELDEILNWIANEEVFGSRAEVDRVMNDLCVELDWTRASHPGVEERTAYLEKSQDIIEQRLSQELKQRKLDATLVTVDKLFYGSEVLAPSLFDRYDEQLSLVPSSVVKEGAEVLREIEPRKLFGGEGNPERYYRRDFEEWKVFYLEASEKEEAVLIYVSG